MDIASIIRLTVLAAIWGASFLFMRIGVPVFGPAALIALRVGLASLFLLAVTVWMKRSLKLAKNWRHYLIIGAFNSAIPFMLFAYAAQSLNASLMSIINATTPIFGAVVAAVWLRTPLTRIALFGLMLGLTGVTIIVGANIDVHGQGWQLALVAALCAPICYGIASSYTKLKALGVDPYDNAHGSMWASTLLVLPLCLFAPIRQTPVIGDWAALTALAVLCTGVAYVLYFRLIRDVGPARALTVTFLVPVFGVLWGAIFLNEPITWSMIAGGLIVLLGTAMSNGLIKFSREG